MASLDVVVPCYQYGHLLRDCVTSVLTQGIHDLRVLIIDNASNDNSVEVARQLAAEDPRVAVIARRANFGPHASYNEGIDWASSDYFLVLNADDFLVQGKLVHAISIMERHSEISFALGRDCRHLQGVPLPVLSLYQADVQWRISTGRRFIERLCRYPIGTVCPVVRTAVQKRAGYYRPELPFTDDLEMLLRLACLGNVAETSASLVVQRLHDSNISRVVWNQPRHRFSEGEAAFESFFANEGRLLANGEELRRLASRTLRASAYWTGVAHLCRGDVRTSLDLFQFALSRRPAWVLVPPIDYIFRIDNPLSRIRNAISDAVGWRRRAPRS